MPQCRMGRYFIYNVICPKMYNMRYYSVRYNYFTIRYFKQKTKLGLHKLFNAAQKHILASLVYSLGKDQTFLKRKVFMK